MEDGYLKLTPLREKYAHRDYTSGKVTSKFHQKYGRVEIRAKHPGGRGLWPAIWMMPQYSVYGGWPASGEIDIFEGRGQNPMVSWVHATNGLKIFRIRNQPFIMVRFHVVTTTNIPVVDQETWVSI